MFPGLGPPDMMVENDGVCFKAALKMLSRNGFVLKIFLSLLLISDIASGQAADSCNAITASMNYTVRSVSIKGRFVPDVLQQKAEQIIGVGTLFDPARLGPAQEEIRTALVSSEQNFFMRFVKQSSSILYIYTKVCPVVTDSTSRQVSVEIFPYYLRVDLVSIGDNILPIPRSARPVFFTQVPTVLKITSPIAGFYNDRNYGPAIFVRTNTDLLHVLGKPSGNKNNGLWHLNFGLQIRKSLSQSFNDIGTGFELNRSDFNVKNLGWSLGGYYGHQSLPLGKEESTRNMFGLNAGITRIRRLLVFSKYAVNAGFRYSRNDFGDQARQFVSERGLRIAFIGDSRIGQGMSRFGIYFDDNLPKNFGAGKSYQRLSSNLGYNTVIGKEHNNIDVEVLAGGGLSWGNVPLYNQFWPGNGARNFMYESLSGMANQGYAPGPSVRSLGENEGGIRNPSGYLQGGSAYWHINFNLSIPIRAWARPLIPDIVISETARRRSTLRSALKGVVETTKNAIISDLIDNDSLPDNEETEKIADNIVNRDIRPTINFLADRANVYAIKPVALFDMARLYNDGNSKTWYAAGAGLQVIIINAKLQAGYMHTLSPVSDHHKGNFFVKLTVSDFY